jgi:hypothetical protein
MRTLPPKMGQVLAPIAPLSRSQALVVTPLVPNSRRKDADPQRALLFPSAPYLAAAGRLFRTSVATAVLRRLHEQVCGE